MVAAQVRVWMISFCVGMLTSVAIQVPLSLVGVGVWWRLAIAQAPVCWTMSRALQRFERESVDA